MSYSSVVTFNGHILYIRSLNVRRVPATKKQIIGKNIIRVNVPGVTTYEREIQINGIMFDTGTTADTQRTNLEGDQDADSHHYIDGLHTGTYFIEELNFDDTEDNTNHYEYSMTIVEDV